MSLNFIVERRVNGKTLYVRSGSVPGSGYELRRVAEREAPRVAGQQLLLASQTTPARVEPPRRMFHDTRPPHWK